MRSLLAGVTIMLAALLSGPARADVLIGVAGPMTGDRAWYGEQMQRGAELAVADINAAGGVLGQHVQLVAADDFCDPEQAVAVARNLVSQGVILVVGHFCSGASIAASEVYAAAEVLEISPVSSNPKLTELGRANVFRVVPRDDASGILVGNYIADHWPDKRIAIFHDSTTFGKGWADETKKQLNKRGLTEAIYKAFLPGKSDYSAEIAELQAADIGILLIGGYHTEVALMARAARDRGYPVQLLTGVTLATEEFGLIAGDAAEGTLFTDPVDPRALTVAASVVGRFRAAGFEPEGYTLHAYAVVQVWAQAAEKSGSLESEALIASLRKQQFETVLGDIDFDETGDLVDQNVVLYVWRAGKYIPRE
jgi:branched-chain amino acid transport system substrate-binding protein